MLGDIWVSTDKLFIRFQIKVLLVFKITYGSREVEISINSTFRDESTSFSDSFLFLFIIWFMIETEFNSLSVSTENTSRITSVGNIEISSLDKEGDIGGTTSIGILVPGRGVLAIRSGLDSLEFLLSIISV